MEIKNLKTIAATGKADNQFVGIKIHKNQIEFHYPETYTLGDSNETLRKDILAILRSISLAKTRTNELSSYNNSHANNNVFPIGAYLWIINDYLTYGRYENREKKFTKGTNGKVNWKKTMQSNPILSEGNIIYDQIISDKKCQKDNLLTEIYNYCVQSSVDNIGWLYGISFDSNGIDYYKKYNRNIYLSAINTELSHTFDDQKKLRLQNMKNIINGLDENIIYTREVVYGVDSYEFVFERMVDSMFSKVDDIRSFYPSATWNLVAESGEIKSSNLRPDTVIVKDKNVYILDAKYYRYGTTFIPGDMPETTSIQKQITYGEYVKKVKSGLYDDVFSTFVLPYSKTDNVKHSLFNHNYEFIGIGKANWIDDEQSNRKIAAILIDTKFLINNWLKKNEDNISDIVALIENHIKDE